MYFSNLVNKISAVQSSSQKFSVANELRSISIAKILDLICEGEIEGFVDRKNKLLNGREIIKGIYLNETVIQESDGTLNHKNVGYFFTNGYQNQSAIDNFTESELPISVNLELKYLVPVIKTISNENVDSFRVTIATPGLYSDPRDGSALREATASFKVEVNSNLDLTYKTLTPLDIPDDINPQIIKGKTLSRYERTLKYKLPEGTTRNIKVTKTTGDSAVPELQVSLFFVSYAEIVSQKLNYPNSAIVALQLNAEDFGSIPSRAYLLKGLKVKVPSNYNPITKEYTGIWDGSFKAGNAEGSNILPNGDFSGGISDWDVFNASKSVSSSGSDMPPGITQYGVISATSTTSSTDWSDRFGIWKLNDTVPVIEGKKYVIRGYYKVNDKNVFAQLICKGGLNEQVQLGNSTAWQQFQVYAMAASEPYIEFSATKYNSTLAGTEAVSFAGLEIALAASDGKEWTDNPAWVYYDLITNKRYGLGNYIKESQIDLASFYTIGRYCDESVYSGFENENPTADSIYLREYPAAAAAVADGELTPYEYWTETGDDLGHVYGKEPRFVCNTYIQSREDSFKVLNDFASVFRGITYWGNRSIIPVQDSPKDCFLQFTNSNVSEDGFTYQSSGKKARHTAAYVRYNNPDDFYRPHIEYVEDVDGIIRYGIKEIEIAAFACTSRGQAHRLGKYILLSELQETETVQFKAGLEGAILKPGDIFKVSDSFKAGQRRGFRIASISGARTSLTLDSEITLASGLSFAKAYITNPTSETTETLLFEANITNSAGTHSVLTLSAAIPVGISLNAVCIVETSDLVAQTYRCIAVEEESLHQFSVFGLQYDVNKFAQVEDLETLPSNPTTSIDRDPVQPVPAITITRRSDVLPGRVRTYLIVEWSESPSAAQGGVQYIVKYSYEGSSWNDTPLGASPTSYRVVEVDIENPGTYTFKVIAVRHNLFSRETIASYEYEDANPLNGFSISGLELFGQGNDTEFFTPDARFTWRLNSPTRSYEIGSEPYGADSGDRDPMFRDFQIIMLDTSGNVLRTEYVLDNQYTYTLGKNHDDGGPDREFTISVKARDKYNTLSNAKSLRVSNPSPDAPVIEAIGGVATITINVSNTQEPDAKAILIHKSTTDDFTPTGTEVGTGTCIYDGPDNSVIFQIPVGTTYHFRAAYYDSFGKNSLNYSDQVSAQSNALIDNVPPGPVVGLALTPGTTTDITGQIYYTLLATWTANSEGDMYGYTLQIRETGTTEWFSFPVDKSVTRHEWPRLKASQSYDVRISASDTSGNFSTWSSVVVASTGQDTTPPGLAVWVSGSLFFRNVYLQWTNPSDYDLKSVEIYENTVNDSATSTKIGESFSDTFIRSFTEAGELFGTVKYYWLKTVDTTGNKSAYSLPLAATLGAIAAPTGVAATSTIEVDNTGVQKVYLNITWDASSHGELSGYAVEVGKVSGAANHWTGIVKDNKARIEVIAFTTYYVRVRVLDLNGGVSIWSTELITVSTKDTVAPAAPTALTASSAFENIFLSWSNPSDIDFKHIEIWASETNDRTAATLIGLESGIGYVHSGLSTGDTWYYWIRAVDTSGNASGYYPSSSTAGVGENAGGIEVALPDFSIEATKMFTNTIILEDDTWQDNHNGTTTAAGYISWNAHTVVYGGAGYAIAAGSTNLQYVYWTGGTSYSALDTLPTLTDGQFIVATNSKDTSNNPSGLHDLVWNAMANAVIGSAFIANGAITNLKVNDMSVDKLTAGSLTGHIMTLLASGSVAAVIKSSNYNGTVDANNVVTSAGTAGVFINSAGYAEFNNIVARGSVTAIAGSFGGVTIASGSVYAGGGNYNNADTPFYLANTGAFSLGNKVVWDGTALTVTGAINATTGYFGSSTNVVQISAAGLNVGTSGSIRGGATGFNVGTGFWMGYETSFYKFFIGTAAGNKLTWDGSALAVTGTVVINTGFLGAAGGWTIDTNRIYTNSSSNSIAAVATGLLSNHNTGFYLQGDGKFRFGAADGTSLLKGISWDGSQLKIMGTLFAVDGTFVGLLSAAQIGTGGLTVTTGLGLRYGSDLGVFTITGGSDNGANHGAQIDLAGNDWGTVNRGALVLAAGNTTSSSDLNAGAIHFRTGDTLVGLWRKNQTFDIYSTVEIYGDLITNGADGRLGGWEADENRLYSGNLVLDGTNTRIQAGPTSGTYVRLDPNGIIGVDSVLGTVFSLPTNGSGPIFSSGTITFTDFVVSTQGVIRTSTTVGDGSGSGYGVLINNTGIKGFRASSSTPTFHLNAADGTFSMGDGVNNYISWNNSVLSIKGSIDLGSTTIDYADIDGTKPPATADVTLAAINGGLNVSGVGINLTGFSNTCIRSGQTAYETGTGFWLGISGGTPLFSIGSVSTGNYLKWTGSNLLMMGGSGSNNVIIGTNGFAVGTSGARRVVMGTYPSTSNSASIFFNNTSDTTLMGMYLNGESTPTIALSTSGKTASIIAGTAGASMSIGSSTQGIGCNINDSLNAYIAINGPSGGAFRPFLRVLENSATYTYYYSNKIDFNDDTNLYRKTSDQLATNDDLFVGDGITRFIYLENGGKIVWGGSSGDTSIYRGGANILKTDDAFEAASLYATSSIRFKDNVQDIKDPLSIVKSLRGVRFDWNNQDKKNDIGVIAEEVEKVLPSIVLKTFGQVQAVDYGKLTAVLIEAVKELTKEIDELKKNGNRN